MKGNRIIMVAHIRSAVSDMRYILNDNSLLLEKSIIL